MTDLSRLGPPKGATQSRKRLGRGPGSGTGKTSGKGHKGHKARTGGQTHPWFEGGQMPLQRRVPKRGFKNAFRRSFQIVNLSAIGRLDADEITPDVLAAHRLVDAGDDRPVKILGEGEIARKVTIRAHAFSASAKTKIEAAGGSAELIEDAV
ncbi:MAG: 50S ribosomal protein L15 [Gemmatimonadetes bacterium]|nr:50S ribosomal protein L15 [Gemmatimonadota bacterium]